MAVSNEVKLEREKRKALKQYYDHEVLMSILKSPVFQIVGAYAAIEFLQHEKWIDDQAGTWAEGGCLIAVAAQQLQPYTPQLFELGGKALESGTQIIKALNPLSLFTGFFK